MRATRRRLLGLRSELARNARDTRGLTRVRFLARRQQDGIIESVCNLLGLSVRGLPPHDIVRVSMIADGLRERNFPTR